MALGIQHLPGVGQPQQVQIQPTLQVQAIRNQQRHQRLDQTLLRTESDIRRLPIGLGQVTRRLQRHSEHHQILSTPLALDIQTYCRRRILRIAALDIRPEALR